MCLIALALNAHADWPLVVLANRDEFHDRPAAPSAWWTSESGLSVLGGRDLKAGGTWMACRSDGTLAALTNIREPGAPAGLRSRGELVMQALQAGQLTGLNTTPYASFNLLMARPHGSGWCVEYANSRGMLHTLSDGVHGVSNGQLNDPWPKTEQLKGRLTDLLTRLNNADAAQACQVADEMMPAAFAALSDRQTFPDEQLPETGVPPEWERMLSACQIVSAAYGTRCSTVVCAHASGQIVWGERTLNPQGQVESTRRWVVDLRALQHRPSV